MPQRDQIVFVNARSSPPREWKNLFEDLIDEKSVSFDRREFERDGTIPNMSDLIELAKAKQGFKIDDDRVTCPVIVVAESNVFSYEAAEMVICFGTDDHRPILMPKEEFKKPILAKMQGVSEHEVSKEACKALIVGLIGIECLVLLPLQDTALRQQDIQQDKERDPVTNRLPNETEAIKRCCRYLIGLERHIHIFDDTGIYGFQTPIVSGNQQKLTKNQVYVPHLLWKGMFKSHPSMMEDALLKKVFIPVSKKRKEQEAPKTQKPAGKSPSYRHEALKRRSTGGKYPQLDGTAHLESKDVRHGLLVELKKAKSQIDPYVYSYLKRFVKKFHEHINEHEYVAELGGFLKSDNPTSELVEYTNELREDPEYQEFVQSLE